MGSPEPRLSGVRKVDSIEESDYLELYKDRAKRQKIYVVVNEDSGELEAEGVLNISDDSEDNETTYEDDESDTDEDCGELDELYDEAEEAGDWTCAGDFKQIPFEGKTGLQNPPKGPDPYNFFEFLFDEKFFSTIVLETNKHADEKMTVKLTIAEFKKFLGLLLHMGTIKCSKIQNYWSPNRLFNFTCFSRHMSRNRFQEILHGMRFAPNIEASNRLNKIQPMIDYFNIKMKTTYYPHKELSVNETTPWRGKLALRRYVAGIKNKYGVKLYVLNESSGIALRIRAYTGSGDGTGSSGHVTKVVTKLLEDFLQKGHSVYMRNFCASFAFSERLLAAKTHCTATLKKLKKGNNKEIVKTKLSKGEVISRYRNCLMVGKFRDKKDVLFISSEFKPKLVDVENKKKEKLRKPFVLHKLNQIINGTDKKDRMLSYYTCSRRTFKWYIKLWIHMVETLLLNSFFLYSKYSVTNKLGFYDYRLNIIETLLFENYSDSKPANVPVTQHMPEILPRGSNNKVKRKRCRQCFFNNIRKETNYFCPACQDNPGLCLGECFKDFHRHRC